MRWSLGVFKAKPPSEPAPSAVGRRAWGNGYGRWRRGTTLIKKGLLTRLK
jgi:hypothetical protein